MPSAGVRVVGGPAEREYRCSDGESENRKLREFSRSPTAGVDTVRHTMSDGDEDPTTEELRIEQGQRETASHTAAKSADTEAEEKAHERRAEKSAYLREKLEERERAEREADDQQ